MYRIVLIFRNGIKYNLYVMHILPKFLSDIGCYLCTACIFQGDSGGPLMCKMANNSTQRVAVGLVSSGPTMCDNSQPQLFTRNTAFLLWIQNTINNNTSTGGS